MITSENGRIRRLNDVLSQTVTTSSSALLSLVLLLWSSVVCVCVRVSAPIIYRSSHPHCIAHNSPQEGSLLRSGGSLISCYNNQCHKLQGENNDTFVITLINKYGNQTLLHGLMGTNK